MEWRLLLTWSAQLGGKEYLYPYIVKPNITPTVQEHVKFAVQRDSYKVLVEVVALTWAM